MYVVENKKGYIKEFTMIFDKVTIFYDSSYKFNKKELKKFFIFRNKKKYKVYKVIEG